MCTAMHVPPQIMHVHAQVDSYHLHTDHPYKYISSSRYANILQFFTQGTTPAKVTVAQKTAPMFAYYIKTHVLLNADMI